MSTARVLSIVSIISIGFAALFGIAAISDSYWHTVEYQTTYGPWAARHELHFGLFRMCGEDGGNELVENSYCHSFEPEAQPPPESRLSSACHTRTLRDRLRTARAFLIMGIIIKVAAAVMRLSDLTGRRSLVLVVLGVAVLFDLIGVSIGADFFYNRYCDVCDEIRREASGLVPPQQLDWCDRSGGQDIGFVIVDLVLCAAAMLCVFVEKTFVRYSEEDEHVSTEMIERHVSSTKTVDTAPQPHAVVPAPARPEEVEIVSTTGNNKRAADARSTSPTSGPAASGRRSPSPMSHPAVHVTAHGTTAFTVAVGSVVRTNATVLKAEERMVQCGAIDRNSSLLELGAVEDYVTALESEGSAEAAELRTHLNVVREARQDVENACRRCHITVPEYDAKAHLLRPGNDSELLRNAFEVLCDKERRLTAAVAEARRRCAHPVGDSATQGDLSLRKIDEALLESRDLLHPMREEMAAAAQSPNRPRQPGGLGLQLNRHLIVTSVVRDPASTGGISERDKIIGIDHVNCPTFEDLVEKMGKYSEGDVLEVQYRKPDDEKLYNASLTLLPK